MIQQEFDTPSAALAHYGKKGMKWGVRNDRKTKVTTKSVKNEELDKSAKRAQAKKVAIGVGVLTAAAGGAFVVHKLNQSGHIPLNTIKQTAKEASVVKKILEEPTQILHASRGKNKGFQFYKNGGIPDPLSVYEQAFGKDNGLSEQFKWVGKTIAASFPDPQGRKDFSGRVIPHQIIIPQTMTAGINNLDDVKEKIWPLLQDTYSYD